MNKAKAEAAEILEKANARASQIINDATSKETEAEKILSAAKTIENDVNKAEELAENVRTDYTSEKILGDEISPKKHQELLKKQHQSYKNDRTVATARPYAKAIFAAALEGVGLMKVAHDLVFCLLYLKPRRFGLIEDPQLSKKIAKP